MRTAESQALVELAAALIVLAVASGSGGVGVCARGCEPVAPACLSGGDGKAQQERIRSILAGADLQRGSVAQAARHLAALGAPAAPALVDALADGEALSAEQREALLGALALIDRTAVLSALELVAASPARERRALLAVLERLGAPDDLALALRAAFPAEAPSLDAELAATVAAVLARHPAGAAGVPRLVAAAGPRAGAALVRGVGAAGRREGIEALTALLDAEVPGLERCLLSEVGRLAAPLAPPFPRRTLEAVRARLGSGDPEVVRAAASSAGTLLDDAALPRLVELLADPRDGIAAAALSSLRSLTTLSLPADPAGWQAWLQAEQEWFDAELSSALARLRNPDRNEALLGLRAVSLRRMRRLELAAEVDPLLQAEDADVCRAACRCIVALGACARLPSLIDCLEDDDADVAAEAWHALQALTGAHLPADPDAWRATFGEAAAVVRR